MDASELRDLDVAGRNEDRRRDSEEEHQWAARASPGAAAQIGDEGDLGLGSHAFATPLVHAGGQPRTSPGYGDVLPELDDLQLPEPALPPPASAAPIHPSLARITNDDRRALASPRIDTTPTPRTRFDLARSPTIPTSKDLGIPLKPILLPSTPRIKPRPAPAATFVLDHDITEFYEHQYGRGGEAENDSPPGSPAFAPRDDDEPHPEHEHHDRIPHPLYTPAPDLERRRRRRRRARSVASSKNTHKSARSRIKSLWATLRRRRSRSHRASSNASSRSSSSSSSSTSSSKTHTGSSHSSSTWHGWRFWRNSSSGSTSSSHSSSDDEWEPPTPHFSLLTPCLSRPTLPFYPDSLLPSRPPSPPASPPPLAFGASTPPMTAPAVPVFDRSSSATLGPSLDRLRQFWMERRQEDGIAGDLGEGVAGAAMEASRGLNEQSYFPEEEGQGHHEDEEGDDEHEDEHHHDEERDEPTGKLGRKLRGEERAERAERERVGEHGAEAMEDKPAWWLDVMCPTVADMRELRKILPLHPLTMEDILHQETREKIESFSALGYYFIVFRALDESYFQYTSPDPESPSLGANEDDSDHFGTPTEGRKKGRVDVVEGVGGKEGVEGVGVGAINLYLVVFPDGIISFHFEDISKHVDRVQGKLQQFGLSRSMSSHWIAYGLMDSIVDAFFPLIDFIEGESKEVDTFLSDPLKTTNGAAVVGPRVAPSGVGVVAGRRVFDEKVIGIVIEPVPGGGGGGKESDDSGEGIAAVRKATVKRHKTTSVLRALPSVALYKWVVRLLPASWVGAGLGTEEVTMMVDAAGFRIRPPLEEGRDDPLTEKLVGLEGVGMASPSFDRLAMLKRITESRKLVTGLSRLLGSKSNVVRGLRRRTKDESMRMFGTGHSTHDISIYFGDLFDHIVAMQKSLNFYDAILSNDHPAYVGVLRLSLTAAKAGTDALLVRLYIVTLTFLPINILTGLFSMNVQIPKNGDRTNHLLADGSLAGYQVFGAVIGGIFFVAILMWLAIWVICKTSKKRVSRRSP